MFQYFIYITQPDINLGQVKGAQYLDYSDEPIIYFAYLYIFSYLLFYGYEVNIIYRFLYSSI